MKPITLYFPDTILLANFILIEGIAGLETNNNAASVKGHLSKHIIEKACEEYGASLNQLQVS